jgi:exopolyphosphatase / guanosine-5'-triphosphate,3'-diphosphate pyrophosphatase
MRVAAIDCGTNSLRLLVADLPANPDEPLVDIVRSMEIVRLGAGVDHTGRLAPAAIERTRAALATYAAQIKDKGALRVRMVATSASRDAENADEFRSMVLATLGTAPEVVTGDDEARLSFAGAVNGMPSTFPAPYLVVDIGGGSTEFVVGTTTVEGAMSVDIGCVRMTERHLRHDPPTASEVAEAVADITATVDRALAAVPAKTARTLVGLAGSVTTVTAIALGLDAYDPVRIHHASVSYARVAAVTEELLAQSAAERLRHSVMHPGRADVIGAGALVLRTVMERSGMDTVVASEHDILDGIAWSLA